MELVPTLLTGPVALRPEMFNALAGRATDVRRELAQSLSAPQAWIAPKFFYDRLGSALFSAICELPEYYPTRTERRIMETAESELARALGPAITLIDLGAGDCGKAARLFESVAPVGYVAVDISVDFLAQSLGRLQQQHPTIPMIGIATDLAQPLLLPPAVSAHRRHFFYPGSSIGNFSPDEATAFLRRIRALTDAQGGLLIGVDLVKSAAVLEPAYDDALGVTAAFNLNILRNVNNLLGSDFDLAYWRHEAWFDARHQRIEMHLRCREDVTVTWPQGVRRFAAGETIHTENSCKYTRESFASLLAAAGFRVEHFWTDSDNWFGVCLARPD